MNVRQPVDYGTMYRELTAILTQNLLQMDEVYAIGKAISQRPEKGAAVAAAEFLQAKFPDRTGFSPRNVRRMRDFYRTYENNQTLLRLAMKIGWTLNVVIMEAELTRDVRKWYLEQALCRGWSKTQLLNAIHSGADSMKYLEQFDSPEKQVDQVAVENPAFIVEVMRNVHPNNDLFEKILGEKQRIKLRRSLLLRVHSECGLNIDFPVSIIDNKVDLLLRIGTLCSVGYNTDIDRVAAPQKLVVDQVFHDMTGIILPVIQARIPKTDICIVILIRIVEICFALDIISFCYGNQKRIDNILHIVRNKRGIDLLVFHAGDSVCDVRWIRQGADLRGKEIENIIQNILTLDAISLNNIFYIQFRVKRGQIILFILIILHRKQPGHTAVQHISVQRFLLIPANKRVILLKAKRKYMDLRCAPAELCCNILGQPFGVAAGDIDIQIFVSLQLIEHIIDRDLDPTVFLIYDFSCELNFVNEQIELFILLSKHQLLHVLTERNGVTVFIIPPLIQFDFNDLRGIRAVIAEIFVKQLKKQHRFSASADAGNDFDLAIPHITNEPVQIIVALNHIFYLELATYTLLLLG